jgi:hypothetical protein
MDLSSRSWCRNTLLQLSRLELFSFETGFFFFGGLVRPLRILPNKGKQQEAQNEKLTTQRAKRRTPQSPAIRRRPPITNARECKAGGMANGEF